MKMTKRIIENIIGLIFIVSAIAKLYDFTNTVQFLISISGMSFEIMKAALVALSSLEIFIGISFFFNVWRDQVIYLTIIITVVLFILLNTYFFFKGYANCGCFGTQITSSPLTSFLKNIIIMVYLVYAAHSERKINMAVE